MQTTTRPEFTEFNTLEAALKTLTGADYDAAEAHPGVLLDQITADDTTVYVWWPADYDTPCLAWNSPRGWSATIVDTDDLGWADDLWYARAHHFGSAMLSAQEPTTLLTLIATACDRATNPSEYNKTHRDKQRGLAWGLRLLLDHDDRIDADTIAANYDCTIEDAGVIDVYADATDPLNAMVAQVLTRNDLLATRPM